LQVEESAILRLAEMGDDNARAHLASLRLREYVLPGLSDDQIVQRLALRVNEVGDVVLRQDPDRSDPVSGA
jgi:hypothetical protein